MLDHLLQLDKDFFLFLNGLGTNTLDGFFLFISNKFSAIPLYLVLLILAYKMLGLKKTVTLLVAVALMITVTDQLSNFFKYGVGRLRPCHDEELYGIIRLVKSSCGGKYSYFSAHAANSFALAIFFGLLLKTKSNWLLSFLALWAGVVAFSRIYLGVHFPLDVVTGALIGSLFGWLFLKLFIFTLLKLNL